ncbi:hypothetical protein GIB67_013125 [Kingdonia uniflora]|uniref:Uncharacterized protein n=1 Tax=Kingdonia uniflora TaxID=39325 RepID=A0A7J7NNQ8_9MAGN|nr:hypothetical protein GIB67_013125 [Kingdonia uniflora]
MVLLCFLLDLRTLSPPLLKDLKQSLLQLANLYAISSGRQFEILRDRIGLCYIQRNKVSCADELKIAYSPRGDFCLRDFHHVVNNLPNDGFLPEMIDSVATTIGGGDVVLTKLLSKEVLYSWGSKDIVRKVILIGSVLVQDINSVRKILIEAADKCVSVEFVLLEQESGQTDDVSRSVQEFGNSISDLENCSLQTYISDRWVFCGLVKRWLQDLKDDLEEPLQAVFLFKSDLVGSTNQIFCNLFTSANQIIDGFIPCQTCRCHGLPLDVSSGNKTKMTAFCPVSRQELGVNNLIENAVRVGEQTILFLPSFQSCPKVQRVVGTISFTVIERTNLSSLSEGLIIGGSYIVLPSASHEMETTSDECDNSEVNNQHISPILCNLLKSQKLAGSEEITPVPDAIRSIDCTVPKHIEGSIQIFLSRMALRDYNPLSHERGFHPKLNLLVKESLQFGAIPLKRKKKSASNSPNLVLLETVPSKDKAVQVEEKIFQLTPATEEDKAVAYVAEEWEQMIVNEDCKIYSPTCMSLPLPKIKTSVLSPPDVSKQMGEKTSRILERLETPRQLKRKASSPVVVTNAVTETCVPKKKPLVPFMPNHAADCGTSLSQPMKPNFQRMKKKQR